MARLKIWLLIALDWLIWRLQAWRAGMTKYPTVAALDEAANSRYGRRLANRYAHWGRR
jgi:hypothetical protein